MRTWNPAVKIGVVVHGPEVIDSGAALKLLNYLQRFGEVTALLGGTMGRVALIDADLGDLIGVSPARRPSQSLLLLQDSSDILVILNSAKTRESGLAFGTQVAAIAGITKPLIQIDCGGRFVAELVGGAGEFAATAATDLGLELQRPVSSESYSREGDISKRLLFGVVPGEPISINGVVVGRATEENVEIEASNGRILNIKGATLKPHGLEKLPAFDLEKSIIRSGKIRRTEARPGSVSCRGSGAALIDHCAEDAFNVAEGTCIAVTVGDDTTSVAGDILARLSIPVIGIVDGDLDGLSCKTTIHPGSTVIRVEPGCDDIIGRRIREEIFQGRDKTSIAADDLLRKITDIAGQSIVQIDRL
ncbi:MAG: DUF2117 domain-containing protein [Methanotrichaceae archaeon]|nr:DUF2117 domain-containing protein [Methanotrichaceae archaeon]